MKKHVLNLIIICMYLIPIIAFPASGENQEKQLRKDEREMVKEWITHHLSENPQPFFSLLYDGVNSSSFLPDWKTDFSSKKIDANKTSHILTFTDTKTNLIIRCIGTSFSNFPAIEWIVEFENSGGADTPIIEKIQAVDLLLFGGESGKYLLHHARGSNHGQNDFAPLLDEIKTNSELVLMPKGGRSSDETSFPFFNIQGESQGVMVGIGWSGQWQASINGEEKGGVVLKAGLEKTHLKLHPGEKIRTPRILLLFWQGEDRMRGHNQFRRFVLAHHAPHKDGQPIIAPFACNGGAFMFNEFTLATEHSMIALAERYQQFGLQADYWWIDAGWYGSMDWDEGGWYRNVGNWYMRKEHFPNGLKPVSEAVNKMGMKFLLWFEPERVWPGTWLDKEHREWIIRKEPEYESGLFNLGIPEARKWLTDFISNMISEYGVEVYRQDFNMRPLDFWRSMDTPDRQGMTEIQHIEGLYIFWDELLKRHPGLIIDNCASGGRRLDLETISRSVALWRSDYNYREPTGRQNHTYGLSLYFPYHGTGCTLPDFYVARSTYSSAMVTGWNLYSDDFPKDQARYIYDEYKKIRHFFLGDFYPLSDYSTRHHKWMAYQFHRQDLDAGMALVFRRPFNEEISYHIILQGLDDETTYELTFENDGAVLTRSGKELKQGLTVKIIERPGSLLITYREI